MNNNMTKTKSTMAATALVLFLSCAITPGLQAGSHADILAFEEAHLFFEQNATDGDLGLHLKVDGEGWDRLILTDMRFHRMIDLQVRGNLGREIGLTEVFSESAEPSFDEVSMEEFLELFPEGTYYYFGRTIEGSWMFGITQLTHTLPGEVELLTPGEGDEVDPEADLVIEWELLDDPNPPNSVIEFYEVVVEKDEEDEMLRVFSVEMLPTDTTIRVPSEFLEAGKAYKVEIIAQETSGNRTAIEVEFETGD